VLWKKCQLALCTFEVLQFYFSASIGCVRLT